MEPDPSKTMIVLGGSLARAMPGAATAMTDASARQWISWRMMLTGTRGRQSILFSIVLGSELD